MGEGRKVSLYRRFVMGAGYLEGYGEHPGTEMCVILCLITGIAGASAGRWLGFVSGLIVGVVVYGSLWASGAVSRADAYLRRQEREPATTGGHNAD